MRKMMGIGAEEISGVKHVDGFGEGFAKTDTDSGF